jgi:tRNA pseudouridine55 synthase
VLLLGRATRLARYVSDLEKSYTATARFGAVSDSLDAEGRITDLDAPLPTEDAIRDTLPAFTGDLLQVPPMASALKSGGTRLYDLHRRGISVEREARPVTIHGFELAALDPTRQTAEFLVSCSSGTYVRTLVDDLATSLGSGAYLTALRRTSVGHLTVDHAIPPQVLPKTLNNHIIPPNEVISHLPEVAISGEAGRGVVCHGGRIARGWIDGSYRVMCGGELLAVYRDDEEAGRPEVVLCAP